MFSPVREQLLGSFGRVGEAAVERSGNARQAAAARSPLGHVLCQRIPHDGTEASPLGPSRPLDALQ